MQITKELIERYHVGQCSLEEQHFVEQWLESDEVEMSFPQNRDLANLEDKGWKKLSKRYPILSVSKPVNLVKMHDYRGAWQLVACFVFVLGLVAFYYTHTIGGDDRQNNAIVYKEIKTVKGQKLNVTLPDGTKAWLNSESALRFPENFRGKIRDVEFSGEAYFSVEKDPLKPFVIRTANTRIQVLGTKFNLRALTAEKATSVVVVEGKVKFSTDSDKQALILTANKRGIFENTSSSVPIVKMEDVYAGKYIAWKNNELLLDNLTIEQAVRTLESWYNVKIIIGRDELRTQRYTGSFNNAALKEVLGSMGFAVKFIYKQHGQTFTLY